MALGTGVTVAQLMVLLRANTAQYDRAMTKSMGTTQKLFGMTASRMQEMGRAWTYSVSLPLAVAGAAAIKTSLDFDRSMTKIASLVGLGEGALADLETQIASISGTTAQTQTELAEAAYFIASSGYKSFAKGGDGLKILEASAQGAMVGMGEVQKVADLVTSVMNAYGSENLDAARTMDILTAAIREGKAEPEQFATSVGRGLAQAQAAGVEFEELSATIASLSLSGISSQRAVTAFIAILRDLQKPSEAGKDALNELDISVEKLQAALATDFLGTLQMLRRRFGDNNSALRDLFKNTVAYNAVLDLTGEKAKEVGKVFEQVDESAADFAKSIRRTAESDSYKMQQAMVDMHSALKDLGDALYPFMKAFATAFALLSRGFSSLPGPLKTLIASFGVFLALFGPMLLMTVKLRIAWTTLIGPLRALQAATALTGAKMTLMQAASLRLTTALGNLRRAATLTKIALGVGLLLVVEHLISKFMEGKARAAEFASVLSGALSAVGAGSASDFEKQLKNVDKLSRQVRAAAKSASTDLRKVSITGNPFAGGIDTDKIRRARLLTDGFREAVESLRTEAVLQNGAQQGATAALADYMEIQADLIAETDKKYQQDVNGISALQGLAVSQEDLNALEEEAAKRKAHLMVAIERYAKEAGLGTEETKSLKESIGGLGGSMDETTDEVKQMTGAISGFLGMNEEDWGKWLTEVTGAVGSFEGVLSDVLGNVELTGDKIANRFEEHFEEMREFVSNMRSAAEHMPKDLFAKMLELGPSDPAGANHFLDHYLDEETTRKRINSTIRAQGRLEAEAYGMIQRIDRKGLDMFNSVAVSARTDLKEARQKVDELMARRQALIHLMHEESGVIKNSVIRQMDDEISRQKERIERAKDATDGIKDLNTQMRKNKQATDPAKVSMDGWAASVLDGSAAAQELSSRLGPILKQMARLERNSSISFSFDGPGTGGPTAAGLFGAAGGSAANMAKVAMAAVPGEQMISSLYRPFDVGSFHSDPMNPAADIAGANLPGVFNFLASTFGNMVRELIYGHTIIEKGKVGYYEPSDHFDHVHVADEGGVFRGPGIVRIGNIDEMMVPAKKMADLSGGGKTVNIEQHFHGDGYVDPKKAAHEMYWAAKTKVM